MNYATIVTLTAAVLSLTVAVTVLFFGNASLGDYGRILEQEVLPARTISVFSTLRQDNPIARKHRQDLEQLADILLSSSSRIQIDLRILSVQEQRSFVEASCGGETVAQRYDHLPTSLAQELYKFCALQQYGGMYLHETSPILNLSVLQKLLKQKDETNFAVLMDSFAPNAIHGSFFFFQHPNSPVAQAMVQFLLDTPLKQLHRSPMLVPRTLYDSIVSQEKEWTLLQQKCTINPFETKQILTTSTGNPPSSRMTYSCPGSSGFCCLLHDPEQAFIATKYPILPFHQLPRTSELPQPYSKSKSKNAVAATALENDPNLAFIATVQERPGNSTSKKKGTSSTFYQRLSKKDCLPSVACDRCLKNKKGSSCSKCQDVCECFCNTLCNEKEPNEPYVAKELVVTPPSFHRDPYRYIPRIVHQTWFEEMTPEKYPHMRRLVESLAQSSWEYRFYTDDDAAQFLSTHFPPEVRQAYDALLPGAFKADLFRYCALLIHGGVYADVDILAGSNLDHAVGPDVGFMVPLDEPGKHVDQKMCLWNGFIAAAPGHPYLAKVIETVVNNIRNRFTSLDVENMFCPVSEISVLHSYSPLFVSGPCILGSMVNTVHNRRGLTKFQPGELNLSYNSKMDTDSKASDAANMFVGIDKDQTQLRIPGRTVILEQNKWDMGAHRFTLLEKNLIVASTDFPDANDREKLDNYEHYSETQVRDRLYGVDGVYKDKHRANEEIRVVIDASVNQRRQKL